MRCPAGRADSSTPSRASINGPRIPIDSLTSTGGGLAGSQDTTSVSSASPFPGAVPRSRPARMPYRYEPVTIRRIRLASATSCPCPTAVLLVLAAQSDVERRRCLPPVTSVKLRLLREGDRIEDGNQVLVRGGERDLAILRDDALRYRRIYGTYGVSVFAVRDLPLEEMAQAIPLVRHGQLTLIRAGEIGAAHLRLDPTGRNRHHFTISSDDLAGIGRLSCCDHETVPNPYYKE